MSTFLKSSLVILLFLPLFSYSQKYFEGEIIYDLDYIKKDSNFNLNNIGAWPAKTASTKVRNGSWIQHMDSGAFEYEFFSRQLNQQIYKFRDSDTLLYLDYSKIPSDLDPVTSIKTLTGTDTVLGKVCNKLVLKTAKMTLTFLYNDYLKINPEWFKNTKGGYYDIIYTHTKSLFLKAIIETDQFVSIIKATKVTFKPVPDGAFPDVAKLPKRKVE